MLGALLCIQMGQGFPDGHLKPFEVPVSSGCAQRGGVMVFCDLALLLLRRVRRGATELKGSMG